MSLSWMRRTILHGTVLICLPILATKSRIRPSTISSCSKTSTLTGPLPVLMPRSSPPSTSTCATTPTLATVEMPKKTLLLIVPTQMVTARCSPPNLPKPKFPRQSAGRTPLMDPTRMVSALSVLVVTSAPPTAPACSSSPSTFGVTTSRPDTPLRLSPPWTFPMKNKILAMFTSRSSTLLGAPRRTCNQF